MLRSFVCLPAIAAMLTFATTPGLGAPAVEFEVLSQYYMAGNAEILQAAANGQFIVHTNSDNKSIDVVDLRDVNKPSTVASLRMPGEPTSVGMSPDGNWAMAVVYVAKSKKGKKPKDPRLPGVLALLDLRDPQNAHVETMIGIGHHPDSIAVTAMGEELVGIIAIENEPLVVKKGRVLDIEAPGHAGDISEPGAIQLLTINPLKPQKYTLQTISLDQTLLEAGAMLFPEDAQPEYVALSPDKSLAAIALQENNGIVVIDINTGNIRSAFSLGKVTDRPADLIDNNRVSFSQVYPRDAKSEALAGTRFPDAIAFSPDGNYLLSADEGELDLTGGRGFSIWSTDGTFLWDDGGELERKAQEYGLYPDQRSHIRGIEVEGVTSAVFAQRSFAFVVSERGSFVAIYDITNPSSPVFHQLLPTETGPESVVALPQRNLVVVAAEKGNALTIIGVRAR